MVKRSITPSRQSSSIAATAAPTQAGLVASDLLHLLPPTLER